jgi:hypothetical protein
MLRITRKQTPSPLKERQGVDDSRFNKPYTGANLKFDLLETSGEPQLNALNPVPRSGQLHNRNSARCVSKVQQKLHAKSNAETGSSPLKERLGVDDYRFNKPYPRAEIFHGVLQWSQTDERRFTHRGNPVHPLPTSSSRRGREWMTRGSPI